MVVEGKGREEGEINRFHPEPDSEACTRGAIWVFQTKLGRKLHISKYYCPAKYEACPKEY